MEREYKHGDKIYYLHPISGLLDNGAVDMWHHYLCEIREAVFIEMDGIKWEYCKILPDNKDNSLSIPSSLIAKNKKQAENLLKHHNEKTWRVIFNLFMDMQADIVSLKEKLKKASDAIKQ